MYPQEKKICYLSTNCSYKPYNDNLCLLRAVAFHLTGSNNLEEKQQTFSSDIWNTVKVMLTISTG